MVKGKESRPSKPQKKESLRATKKVGGGKSATTGVQMELFNAPFENLPLREAIDFYKHERDWANRLIAGDSLLVMNSLIQKLSYLMSNILR